MKKLSFVAVALSGIFCFTLPSLSLSAENSVVAPVSQNEMSKETYENSEKLCLKARLMICANLLTAVLTLIALITEKYIIVCY